MVDVTCLGILVADVVGKPIDRLPARGRLALVDRMELHPGGCAANTGIGLARLGMSTAIAGKVGSDGFGDYLVSCFEGHCIDTSGVVRDRVAATSSTMVLVHEDGERSFLHYLGANANLHYEDINKQKLFDTKMLHVAGALVMPGIDGEPTARLLKEAREAGVITSLDTVWDATGAWRTKIAPCLPFIDYLLPSYEEARMLTNGKEDPQEIADDLIGAGVGVVGLKMGERGCFVKSRAGSAFYLPALPVNAVDALGAGDAFVAGFLAGIVKGWDVERSAHLAIAVGASCVTELGATTGIMDLEKTLAFAKALSGAPAEV